MSAEHWILSSILNHIAYRKVSSIDIRYAWGRFTLHDSWEDAHAALMKRNHARIEKARREFEAAKRSHAKALKMTAGSKG